MGEMAAKVCRTAATMTRRKVLRTGLAIGATVAFPAKVLAFAGEDVIPIYKVIHDDRFAASQHFGEEAARLGLHAHAVSDGIHDVWYNDLYRQWRERPLAVAGMTTHDAMFLLALMGQDAGLRVVFRAHHQADGDSVNHTLFGPRETITRLPELSDKGDRWSREAAHIVASWPKRAVSRSQSQSTILAAANQPLHRDALITWVMAPVARPI